MIKKQLRFLHVSLLLLMAMLILISSQNFVYALGTSAESIIKPSDAKIHYMGRVDKTEPDSVKLIWSGSSISAKFQGTSLKMEIENTSDNYLNVFIDDQLTVIKCQNGNSTVSLASGLQDTVHTVLVYKRTEASVGPVAFKGFVLDSGKQLVAPLARKSRKIEFYGDAVAVGGCNEDIGEDQWDNHATHNNYMSYSAITARDLNAEFMCTAVSGIGLTKGFQPYTMPQIWDKSWYHPKSAPWDYQSWQADVVVVDLGQNDESTGANGDFKAQYITFINNIREKYPNALIYCVLGPMHIGQNQIYSGYISSAVDAIKAKGDTKVFFHKFSQYTNWLHPRVATHIEMAKELVSVIKNEIWKDTDPLTSDDMARSLYNIGLYKGNSSVDYLPALDSPLTREQGIALMLRLMGLEDAALQMDDTSADIVLNGFSDRASVSSWSRKMVAYSKKQGIVAGFPDGTIQANQNLTGNQYAILILKAMGYTGVSFGNAASELATKAGLKVSDYSLLSNIGIKRSNAVVMSYSCLAVNLNGSNKRLIKSLVESGDVSEVNAKTEKFVLTDSTTTTPSNTLPTTANTPTPTPAPTPDPTPSPTPTSTPNTANGIKYSFETGREGWVGNTELLWGYGGCEVSQDLTKALGGSGSLKVTAAGGKKYKIAAPPSDISIGKKYTFNIYIPAGSLVTGVNPFYQDKDWGWKDSWHDDSTGLKYGEWISCSIDIPSSVQGPIQAFGIEFHTSGEGEAIVYVDNIIQE